MGPALIKFLNRDYPPSSTVDRTFRGNELTIVSNENGEAIQVFIGKRKADGNIKGERYRRTLIRNKDGLIIKDHWERKGPAS